MDEDTDEPTDTGEAPEPLAPRANPNLLGHEAAEASLLQAHLAGRLPHALIIGGPVGIGKATLAYRLARFLLAEEGEGGGLFGAAAPPTSLAIAAGHPVFRRIAASGHADLLTIERAWDVKRKRQRSEIVVDDTRAVAGFLRLTAAEGGWRVVIIDGADEMNRNAANAVLKILEEPPRRTVLLLVTHNPGRLLPTIRSRCRKLTLQKLAPQIVTRLLAQYRPDLSPADAAALALLGDGSIGRALALASGGLELYRALVELAARLPLLDVVALHGFADRLGRYGAEDAFGMVGELLPGWIARLVTLAATGQGAGEIVPGEHAAMRRLASRRSLDQWVEVWEKIGRLFAQADSVNLDRKQVVLNAFFALEGAAR